MVESLTTPKDADRGLTLIELLVVMVIIGVLAAIAIPLFLTQRAKAKDSAAIADVSKIGKEVSTYFVDAAPGTVPVVAQTVATPARYTLDGADIGRASLGVYLDTQFVQSPTIWCVSVNAPGAARPHWQYTATGGLGDGACTSAAG